MIEFDDSGVPVNVGLQTVHAAGFKTGDMIVKTVHYAGRGTAHLRGTLFELTFIGADGSVSLTQVDAAGQLTQHITQKDMSDFMND